MNWKPTQTRLHHHYHRGLCILALAALSGCASPSTRTGDPSSFDFGGSVNPNDLGAVDVGPRDLAYADFRPQADFAHNDFATGSDLVATPADLAGSPPDLTGAPQDLSATMADLSMSAPDLSAAIPDLATPPPDIATPPDFSTPPDFTTVVLGSTGDACGSSAQCPGGAGGAGVCASTIDGATAPNNYCTSPCDPANTNPFTGKNSDCPSGTVCDSNGNQCRKKCSRTSDCRSMYACFNLSGGGACLPASLSQCDPAKAGSCGANKTCVSVGDGVGSCYAACDPMQLNQCKKPFFPPFPACHVSPLTGEGACVTGSLIPPPFCTNSYSDCGDSTGCLNPGLSGACYRYCNDANVMTNCAAGATCQKLPGSSFPTSQVGICSM